MSVAHEIFVNTVPSGISGDGPGMLPQGQMNDAAGK
jgi:hypothetical protein